MICARPPRRRLHGIRRASHDDRPGAWALIESVILRRAVGVAWPVWDLLLFAFGLIAAAGAFALHYQEGRPRS